MPNQRFALPKPGFRCQNLEVADDILTAGLLVTDQDGGEWLGYDGQGSTVVVAGYPRREESRKGIEWLLLEMSIV